MKFSSLQILAMKLALFTAGLGYLALDLWVFEGPVYGMLHPDRPVAKAQPVAEVFGEPVTAEQLRRHTAEQNMICGRDLADNSRRATMVLGLVHDSLLRIRARYNDRNLPGFRQEAADEAARLATRAADDAAFAAQLESQGYTREHFTAKIEARMLKQAQLERAIAPNTEVTDEALQLHYDQVKDELAIPESRSVKHIFLATLNKDAARVKAAAEAVAARLAAGEDFAALAEECSEDERTAAAGGELGLLYAGTAMPIDGALLFGVGAMPADTPTLVESPLGWHIVQVGAVVPGRIPTLEECGDSLRPAIKSAQAELATDAYFSAGLKEGLHDKRIKIYAGNK